MSLNNTPSGERIHIGLFGRRNAGKSSIINAVTGQNLERYYKCGTDSNDLGRTNEKPGGNGSNKLTETDNSYIAAVAGEGLEIIGSNEEEPGRCRIFGWRRF